MTASYTRFGALRAGPWKQIGSGIVAPQSAPAAPNAGVTVEHRFARWLVLMEDTVDTVELTHGRFIDDTFVVEGVEVLGIGDNSVTVLVDGDTIAAYISAIDGDPGDGCRLLAKGVDVTLPNGGGSRYWSDPVPTPADLPETDPGGTVRIVLDDGDGNRASYVSEEDGTWTKLSDPDASGVTLPLSVANGGTGGTSQATARTGIGLGNSSTKDVGTIAGTVAAGDDSRLSNARTPTAHATSHKDGGSDEVGTATPAAAAIPKASAAGTLYTWVPDAFRELVVTRSGAAGAGSTSSAVQTTRVRRGRAVVATAFDGGATGQVGKTSSAAAYLSLDATFMSTLNAEVTFEVDDPLSAEALMVTSVGSSTVGSLRVTFDHVVTPS